MTGIAQPLPFSVGDHVTVLSLGKQGHIRTPDYVLEKSGVVIQFCGYFLNPEDLSVGKTSGPMVPLYRVQFLMSHLWHNTQHRPNDLLCIEIYGHWLALTKETAA
ncbi:MAG: nitrile hydratase subunit beta [Polaromonas sp.]|nr:nitrile hydratase subunit beta [Polaromonas sp.]